MGDSLVKKTILLFFILCSLVVSSTCQDLIYTVIAVKEGQGSALDSILFENVSNKTRVCFGNLPVQTSYRVNLTDKGIVSFAPGDISSGRDAFFIHSNKAGTLTVGSMPDRPETVTIAVFLPNGQLVYKSAKRLVFPGDLTSVHIGKTGIYVVAFFSGSGIQTFKAAGKDNGGAVGVTTGAADHGTLPVKSGGILLDGDFSFSEGDSLRVSVYKDPYYSRPLAFRISESQTLNFLLTPSTVAQTGISDGYVALTEETTRVISYDDSTGVVEMSFTGDKPDLYPGDVITVDLDTMGYLRKIVTVTEQNGVTTLVTEQATMNEVFVDKTFNLHTGLMNPGVQLKSTASPAEISAALTDEKGYIHPVKVIFQGKDGRRTTISALKLKEATDSTLPVIDFYRDLHIDLYGSASDNIRLYIGEGYVSLTTDAVFDFKFTYEGELDESTKVKKGDLEMFKFYLDAEAGFLAKLVLAMGKSYYVEDTKKLIDLKDFTVQFFVSTVPVWINFDVDIYGRYQFSADATLSADWGFESKHKLKAGGTYYQETDNFEPFSEYFPTNTVFPLTLSGEVNALARLELYPRLDVKFYNFFGPFVEIVPYIQGAYNSGVQSQITPSGLRNFLAWNSGISLGLDFRVGTELDFLGLFTKEFGPIEIPCFDLPLWQSPTDVSLVSYLPAETEPGSEIPLIFKVTDLFGLPAPLCPVYVGGDGSFSDYLLFTGINGEASVTWTPGSDEGGKSVSAAIFKFDKTVIKDTTYTTVVKESNSGDTTKFTDPRDGQVYNWVQIGSQVWMAENLAWLPAVNPPNAGSFTAPHYYVYGFEGAEVTAAKATANFSIYGVLYNWPAAMTACPEGWHLPGIEEWTTLSDFLGGDSIAGGKMKTTTSWASPNSAATNESGFSGLPGGGRSSVGTFYDFGNFGIFWSSTSKSTNGAWYLYLGYSRTDLFWYYYEKVKDCGFSVRCVKNN